MNTVISVFELPTYLIREQPNTLTKNLHNYHLNYYCDGNEIIIQKNAASIAFSGFICVLHLIWNTLFLCL